MKVSDFIEELKELMFREGDVEVLFDDGAGQDYDISSVKISIYQDIKANSFTKYIVIGK